MAATAPKLACPAGRGRIRLYHHNGPPSRLELERPYRVRLRNPDWVDNTIQELGTPPPTRFAERTRMTKAWSWPRLCCAPIANPICWPQISFRSRHYGGAQNVEKFVWGILG